MTGPVPFLGTRIVRPTGYGWLKALRANSDHLKAASALQMSQSMNPRRNRLNRALTLLLLFVGTSAHAGEARDITGEWESLEIRCIGMKDPTPKIEISGVFQPHSRLHVEALQGAVSSSGEPSLYRVSKSVTQKSCQNPGLASEDLLNSSFVASAQKVKRDAATNDMRSLVLQGLELIDYKINRNALFACHPLIAALSYVQFPEYFTREATRTYLVHLSGDNLLVYFKDADVCSSGYARAIYRHPAQP